MADYVWSSDGKVLGKGADGEVRVGSHKLTGEKVAIKKMYPYEHLYNNLMEEASIMDEVMDHPNILKLLGLTTNNQGTFMVFELMDTDLARLAWSAKLVAEDIKSVMRQLLEGLAWLHKKKIVHQDVKSSNVLVKRSGSDKQQQQLVVKLADFTNARRLRTTQWASRVGTLAYNAPEVLRAEIKNYGTSVDIWSAGCVFAELLLGTNPFSLDNEEEVGMVADFARLNIGGGRSRGRKTEEEEEEQTLEKIRNWEVERRWTEIRDPKAVELLSRLLTVDPANRISAEGALKLPYFRDSCCERGQEKSEEAPKVLPPQMATRGVNLRPAWLQKKGPAVAA